MADTSIAAFIFGCNFYWITRYRVVFFSIGEREDLKNRTKELLSLFLKNCELTCKCCRNRGVDTRASHLPFSLYVTPDFCLKITNKHKQYRLICSLLCRPMTSQLNCLWLQISVGLVHDNTR